MFNTGIIFNIKRVVDRIRYKEIRYIPRRLEVPDQLIGSKSQAWIGLEKIIADIIDFSDINTNVALEFGVEFGYSTAVFSNYFKRVIGVDTFAGDIHAGFHGDIFSEAEKNLKNFPNVQLVKSDYKDFILKNDGHYDLIHVDIVHNYEDTLACGLWAASHSDCTLFHDTMSFPDVKRAVAEIATRLNKKFYNYEKCNGLGILV